MSTQPHEELLTDEGRELDEALRVTGLLCVPRTVRLTPLIFRLRKLSKRSQSPGTERSSRGGSDVRELLEGRKAKGTPDVSDTPKDRVLTEAESFFLQ